MTWETREVNNGVDKATVHEWNKDVSSDIEPGRRLMMQLIEWSDVGFISLLAQSSEPLGCHHQQVHSIQMHLEIGDLRGLHQVIGEILERYGK
jgi:hypothetical protein